MIRLGLGGCLVGEGVVGVTSGSAIRVFLLFGRELNVLDRHERVLYWHRGYWLVQGLEYALLYI